MSCSRFRCCGRGESIRVAFRDVEFRALPSEPPLTIQPVTLSAVAGKSVRMAWEPAAGRTPSSAVPVPLTLEREGRIFLKAETKLGAVGDSVALSPLELALPHGLPAGTYAVIADTRRVPISGQPSRKARVGTLEVESPQRHLNP